MQGIDGYKRRPEFIEINQETIQIERQKAEFKSTKRGSAYMLTTNKGFIESDTQN